jgi:F-type H+-transporting ATPase subunit a
MTLITFAPTQVLAGLSAAEGNGFSAPSLSDFFPGQLFGTGTWWGPTRINLIALLMAGAVALFFVAAFRKPGVVPSRLQLLGEIGVTFVRSQIIDEVIGKQGRRFLPYLVTLFFMVFALNIAGVLPALNMAGSAVIGVPMFLAGVTWVVFNVVGVQTHGLVGYLRINLFPPGVPKPLYLLLTPIEAISTFVLRPVTLTIRLMANMMAGHFMLVLFFAASSYLLFEAQATLKPLGIVAVAMGFAFTLFEILIAGLQAYIFTLLTALYIGGAMSEAH